MNILVLAITEPSELLAAPIASAPLGVRAKLRIENFDVLDVSMPPTMNQLIAYHAALRESVVAGMTPDDVANLIHAVVYLGYRSPVKS